MTDTLRAPLAVEQAAFDFSDTVSAPAVPKLDVPLDHPLVLDLDRTLIKTDLLFETFAAALYKNPFVIFAVAFWLLKGKAHLKRKLAEFTAIDLVSIPANELVVALSEAEYARGRSIVLATAADEVLANRIARRFGFINRVIASDGRLNLKGAAKAEVLSEAYPSGFAYAGDSAVDKPIWAEASAIIAVNTDAATSRYVASLRKPLICFSSPPSQLKTVLRALRVKQWAKNALVFAPLALSGMLLDAQAWLLSVMAFLSLGLVASSTYLINDLFDLTDDRNHWTKRARPLASGDMRIEQALLLVPLLFVAGFAIAAFANVFVLAVVALYAVVTLTYSLFLKRIPILDVAVLASLFTLRLFLGVVAIGAVISPWLFIFSMALFLSLSTAKRHTEVVRMVLNGKTKASGRGYIARDEPLLLAMGISAGMSAIILFSLYLTAEAVRAAYYSAPNFLWTAPVILLLWLGRVWILSQRGELNDDPVAFAIKDKYSLLLGLALGLSYALAALGGNIPWSF